MELISVDASPPDPYRNRVSIRVRLMPFEVRLLEGVVAVDERVKAARNQLLISQRTHDIFRAWECARRVRYELEQMRQSLSEMPVADDSGSEAPTKLFTSEERESAYRGLFSVLATPMDTNTCRSSVVESENPTFKQAFLTSPDLLDLLDSIDVVMVEADQHNWAIVFAM